MTRDNINNTNSGNTGYRRLKFGNFLASDPYLSDSGNDGDEEAHTGRRESSASAASPRRSNDEGEGTTPPYEMSPWHDPSPYVNSPWSSSTRAHAPPRTGLVGSLVREEGHVYSLAARGSLLYTGSESNNIRVWRDLKPHSGFKSASGFVKAIVVHGGKVFTGHQDGKIRVWRAGSNRRIGSLPRFKDVVKQSVNPRNYVEVRRHRNRLRIRHYDAVSCLALSEDETVLYSGSWDRTVKCWRVSDSRCLESVPAHDDAVNSVACGPGRLVFTGSADGKVKAWRREVVQGGRRTRHVLVQVLLSQDSAVTAVAVNKSAAAIYCGSSDGLVNYWSLSCEKKHKQQCSFSHGGVMRGHRQAILCLASAGTLVFSGSADKTICVWKRDAGGDHACLSVLTGHAGPVKCLAVGEDPNPTDETDIGWILYSGSLDRSVRVWRVADTAPRWTDAAAGKRMRLLENDKRT